MKSISQAFFLWLIVATVVMVGCEQNDDDKIMEAQSCLDQARAAADVPACKSILSGITGERANRIRCSLEILGDGVTQDQIVASYQNVNSTAQDPVLEVGMGISLGDLNGDASVDAFEIAAAQEIVDLCYLTDSTGLKTIAQLILFGTETKSATQIACPDPTDPAYLSCVQTNIANLPDDQAGTFAISSFQLYCVPTFTNQDICTSLQTAGADTSTDPTTVGAALKTCLAANTCR